MKMVYRREALSAEAVILALGCFVFVQEIYVTRGAVGMRQTTSDRINSGGVPIGFFCYPATRSIIEEADRNDKSEALEDP
jgi:hypothetical protein